METRNVTTEIIYFSKSQMVVITNSIQIDPEYHVKYLIRRDLKHLSSIFKKKKKKVQKWIRIGHKLKDLIRNLVKKEVSVSGKLLLSYALS